MKKTTQQAITPWMDQLQKNGAKIEAKIKQAKKTQCIMCGVQNRTDRHNCKYCTKPLTSTLL